MSEYIVRETGYPGTIKQEIVQELVRCKDCQCWDTDWTPERAQNGEHYCIIVDKVTEPDWNCVQFAEVVAWMPLPEPWRGEE